MAVLVEGYSVVVRRSAIDLRYDGGWPAFVAAVPTWLFAADKDLASVGFESPDEAAAYCEELAAAGLSFGEYNTIPDVAVVDMFEGLLTSTAWLEFARVDFDDQGHQISVCWLPRDDELGGTPGSSLLELKVVVPQGWTYEDSLNANGGAVTGAVAQEELSERLEFVRHDPGGVDVYRDRISGEELYACGSLDDPSYGTND